MPEEQIPEKTIAYRREGVLEEQIPEKALACRREGDGSKVLNHDGTTLRAGAQNSRRLASYQVCLFTASRQAYPLSCWRQPL